MHLMLLGAPGSGKGTQAVRLAQYFRLAHLSTGDMLRATCGEGGELGLVVDEYLKEGQLVPDHLVVQLVLDSLDCNGTASGFIMDGFPRTLRQAKGCDVILTQRALALDAVILIDVANEIRLGVQPEDLDALVDEPGLGPDPLAIALAPPGEPAVLVVRPLVVDLPELPDFRDRRGSHVLPFSCLSVHPSIPCLYPALRRLDRRKGTREPANRPTRGAHAEHRSRSIGSAG